MLITIVGLGVIGGSYALALEKIKAKLYGIDTNNNSIRRAIEMGIIRDGALYNTQEAERMIKLTDLLILCIYPNDIKKFLEKYKHCFKESLIITDVTGIKHKLIDEITNMLPNGVDFIFTHPMAGREKRGIDYSSEYIFKKANFIITPIPTNKESNIKIIEDLARCMRFKRITRISPEEHDKIIALTSQLPHVIAVSLINSDDLNIDTGAFIGDSYREITRIANINEDLWSQLFLGNKENLIDRIEKFQEELSNIKKQLKNDDVNTLKIIFKSASRKRSVLD